ncbi:MAG: hypothetical protein GZ085_11205 [Sulfuriferula multivorans]|uniref:Uncharacterized protein n=1 Tax=Sulfuriferula multivorans TaxID=1559896 RepID=A0A7C9P8V1_9PROT|nr:hypothetical protein [Sulfuriferula multivorans]
MTPMEKAIANCREAAKASNEAGEKSRAAENERDLLRQKFSALESSITSAEQTHANADVAQRLGESSDLEATQAALDAARVAMTDAAPDLRHKIRVADLLVEKFGSMALDAAAKHQEALAELNARWIEELIQRLIAEVGKANHLADELVAAQDKATATRQLIEESRQRAGVVIGWKEEEMKSVYYKNLPHPDADARMAHKQALQAEFAAAARF